MTAGEVVQKRGAAHNCRGSNQGWMKIPGQVSWAQCDKPKWKRKRSRELNITIPNLPQSSRAALAQSLRSTALWVRTLAPSPPPSFTYRDKRG